MVRRAQEPEQDVTLTGATNKQDFPARVVADDKAQDDNHKRVQAAKKADLERQMFDEQREQLDEKPATRSLPTGTRVTGPKDVVENLHRGLTEPSK